MVDYDGTVRFSNVVSAHGSGEDSPGGRVYPNPTYGDVTFELPPSLRGEWLSLYDLQGRCIETVHLPATPTVDVNMSDYPAGVYTAILGDITYRVIKK